jgi:hypothetical protein
MTGPATKLTINLIFLFSTTIKNSVPSAKEHQNNPWHRSRHPDDGMGSDMYRRLQCQIR